MKPLIRLFAPLFILVFAARAEAVMVTDSLGPHTFTTPPTRVVALNWAVAEELIALDVTPVGMADIEGYREWVVQPPLPEGIADVGLRAEPSLERIAELAPDLILVGSQQGHLVDKLQRIAPVLFFDNYRADHDNRQAVDRAFLQLARTLGREGAAQARLAEREQRLSTLRGRLQEHFGGTPPPVAVVRFVDAAHARLYGKNSLVEAAMTGLGLEPALPQPATTWGQSQKKLTELARVKQGAVLHIEPFPKAEALFATPLWQVMPFVRNDRFAAIRPVWTYGGATSVGHLAEAISDALLTLSPAPTAP